MAARYQIIEALDSRYGDHQLASGYHCQLKARTQFVGAFLQEFTMVIEQMAHCALLRAHEHYNLKEAAHAFAAGQIYETAATPRRREYTEIPFEAGGR
jgi:hypothetical protein